jgi:hypothetical protein
MYLPIIKNKKLFEKPLTKLKGFEEANKSAGINSHAILFLPEKQILAVAGIHELNDNSQKLTLYKIDATIDESASYLKKLHTAKYTKKRRDIYQHRKRNSELTPISQRTILENVDLEGKEKRKTNKTNSGQSMKVGEKTMDQIETEFGQIQDSQLSIIIFVFFFHEFNLFGFF